LGDTALGHTQALKSLLSDIRIQRNQEHLQETERLLRSVREVARQRSQARAVLRLHG